MIEGRHGGSGAACGPRPKLPHFIYTSLRPTGFGLGHASLCITVHPLPLHNTHPIPPKAPFWQWDRMSNFFVSHADVRTLYSIKWTQWQSADRQRLSRGDFFLSDPGLKPIYHTEKSHLRPVGSRSDAPRKSPLGNTIVLLPAWFFQPIIIIFT